MKTHNRDGSALLMVVGLLTFIVMIGTTFLIVSRMHSVQARAMINNNSVAPVAEGLIARIRTIIGKDRYCSPTLGPYGSPAPMGNRVAAAWTSFYDFPDEGISPWATEGQDRFLCESGIGSVGNYQHISNIFDTVNNSGFVVNTGFQGAWAGGDANTWYDYVDTDGDGYVDAYIFPTNATGPSGDRYQAGVRIIDLSSLACVNTATGTTELTLSSTVCPSNLALNSMLAANGMYAALHSGANGRCGGTNPSTSQFYYDFASRLYSPRSGAYKPFSIGDETCLRYVGNTNSARAGRLYNLLSTYDKRYLLTTLSASHNFVRRINQNLPVGTGEVNASGQPTTGFTTRVLLDTSSDGNRQAVYRRMVKFLQELNVGTDDAFRKRTAANFVANLWAAQAANKDDAPYAFVAPAYESTGDTFAGTYRAFGAVPQVVFTEAFAGQKKETVAGQGDNVTGSAVEIFNPTGAAIDMTSAAYGTGNYRDVYKLIVAETSTEVTTVSGSIPSQGRMVLYNFDPHTGSGTQTDVGLPGTFPAGWTKVDGLKLEAVAASNQTLMLVREVQQNVSGTWTAVFKIPVDQISPQTDMALGGNAAAGTSYSKDVRRDDEPNLRARYNLAVYKTGKDGSGDPAAADQALGNAKSIAWNDADFTTAKADYGVPILPWNRAIRSIGEVGDVLLVGPGATTAGVLTSLPKTAKDIQAVLGFGDTPARGRLDFHPPALVANAGLNGWGGNATNDNGVTGKMYPDVPMGAMLGEFFTMASVDTTRTQTPARVYGRVNINTAPADVLKLLPFRSKLTFSGTTTQINVDANMLANIIVKYRLHASYNASYNYSSRLAAVGSGIAGLRSPPANLVGGFMTADEIAIPLGDYVERQLSAITFSNPATKVPANPRVWDKQVCQRPDYIQARDSLYRDIANVITASSDVFGVSMAVMVDRNGNKGLWRYIAVIDRGNVLKPDDMPALLMFTEIK